MLYSNARIVTRTDIVHGTMEVGDGRIQDLGCGKKNPPGAVDFEGDYLLPGLVDLHTDALLGHHTPRPGVRWPVSAALAAHDGQMATSGVTTVFDALPLGAGGEDEDASRDRLRAAVDELHEAHSSHLRAEHFLHLRLEVSHADTAKVFLDFADLPRLRLVSVMDHTPGQGQFADLDRWKANYRAGIRGGEVKAVAEAEARLSVKLAAHHRYAGPNRAAIASMARDLGLPLASHDDRTAREVKEGAAAGVSICEFPVTLEAAGTARALGLSVLMGGPNLVLGRSHSGNAAASDVAARGWLDGLTSDYVPSSMLQGAFLMAEREHRGLPEAIAMVTSAPARMARLDDRGSIEAGMRADFIRVRSIGGIPRVISVWREGTRVA
jgi:alpha-D-ribose 1-methylphosphonate 5-triphosphate diphosphatase